MDKYLVTQEQYQKLMRDNPSRWKSGQESRRAGALVRRREVLQRAFPPEGLKPCYDLKTWQCNFDANGYRLPTEAEWEYACRAGTRTAYFFGNTVSGLADYAWFEKNSGGHPQPVGQKKPNPWGLYDICGNVWQWCNDFYKVDYYPQSPKENPRGPEKGDSQGGSRRRLEVQRRQLPLRLSLQREPRLRGRLLRLRHLRLPLRPQRPDSEMTQDGISIL